MIPSMTPTRRRGGVKGPDAGGARGVAWIPRAWANATGRSGFEHSWHAGDQDGYARLDLSAANLDPLPRRHRAHLPRRLPLRYGFLTAKLRDAQPRFIQAR